MYIKRDRINHAYLIETNSADRLSLAYSLITKILELSNKRNRITKKNKYNKKRN